MPFYYLNDSNQPVGPLDLLAIKKLEKAGLVAHDVLVCEAGREDWAPLSEKIEPEPQPASPRPPRTAPPPRTTRQPRSGLPPRRFSVPFTDPEAQSSEPSGSSAATYPDWFALASMIVGITAILTMCIPGLSILLAAPALTLGILAYRQAITLKKPFAVTGIVTASTALVATLGILTLGPGGGLFGNPATKYVGSWQNDLSTQFMAAKLDHSVMVIIDRDGRFTEVSGIQMGGVNYDTGSAMRVANGEKTTGYWKWDRSRKALVTRHDGGNPTAYMDGANNDGRSFHSGPFDGGPSSMKSGEEFWVFKPDPNDSDVLIGVHPTLYHNRTMRFYRLR